MGGFELPRRSRNSHARFAETRRRTNIEAMPLVRTGNSSAAERGFLQDRALAGELAARFYRSWSRQGRQISIGRGPRLLRPLGAKAKVASTARQEQSRIRPQASLAAKPTIGDVCEQFDLATVIKMSEPWPARSYSRS